MTSPLQAFTRKYCSVGDVIRWFIGGIIRVKLQKPPCCWRRYGVVSVDHQIVENCGLIIEPANAERGALITVGPDEEGYVNELSLS